LEGAPALCRVRGLEEEAAGKISLIEPLDRPTLSSLVGDPEYISA
jgi:hypothetical protein